MSYIDVTNTLLSLYSNADNHTLVLCPGFDLIGVKTNNPTIDLNEWLIKSLRDNGRQFDLVIASRVLEHLPMRNIDYYLYNIYNVMKKDGLFISIIPDMNEILYLLNNEYTSPNPDWFLINRLNFELFGEGEHHWDFHKTFTTELSMRYILERERLFIVDKVNKINIETDIVPPYLLFKTRRT
jgi:predicted SAM-dependent methyltransferase